MIAIYIHIYQVFFILAVLISFYGKYLIKRDSRELHDDIFGATIFDQSINQSIKQFKFFYNFDRNNFEYTLKKETLIFIKIIKYLSLGFLLMTAGLFIVPIICAK